MTELVRKFLKLHQRQLQIDHKIVVPKNKIFSNDFCTMIDLDKKDNEGESLFLSLLHDVSDYNLKIVLSSAHHVLLSKFEATIELETIINDFDTMDDTSLVLTYGKGILDSSYCFSYKEAEIEASNPIQKIDFFIEYIDKMLKL